MKFSDLTADDFDDMHHALGRPANPGCYVRRNNFCLEMSGPKRLRFEATGCWNFLRTINDGRDGVYRVNNAGIEALAEWQRAKTGESFL